MRGFSLLCAAALSALGLTFALDLYQHRIERPGKTAVVFASMWAPGEPMQQAYERLFRRFEREYPQYYVAARWDGRWVLPAIRPRLLTRSEIPDLINTDRASLQILVDEGYLEPLDALLDALPHPDERGKRLREAFDPRLLARCAFGSKPGARRRASRATYLIPAGVWLHLVFYNRLHYQRLGLEVPRTWPELLRNAERLQAAGIAPFTADEYGYAEQWPEALLPQAVGEDALRASVQGSTGLRFDRDARYRAVFVAIRELHRPGFFSKGWTGSQWPASQRAWIQGRATHLINGSWILRETQSYKPDPEVVQVGAFPVPRLVGRAFEGQGRTTKSAVYAEIPGYALLRGSHDRAGALQLMRFLSRRDSAEQLARVAHEIPAVRGARFPPTLVDLERHLQSVELLLTGGTRVYAPTWHKFVLRELFTPFFTRESAEHPEFITVDRFLGELQRRTEALQRRELRAETR